MVSEKSLVVCLVVVNVIFLCSAGMMLFFDAKNYIQQEKSTSQLDKATRPTGNMRHLGALSVLVSGVKVTMAVFSIVGIMIDSKWLIIACMVFVFLDTIVRLLLGGLLIVNRMLIYKDTGYRLKKVFHKYGGNHSQEARNFTKDINAFMKSNLCCGWSDIERQNLFINTSWFKNREVSDEDLELLGDKPQTLPESCCTPKAIKNEKKAECLTARNMRNAIAKEYIHSNNCLKVYLRVQIFHMYLSIGFHGLIIILDLVSMIVSWIIVRSESDDNKRYSMSSVDSE